MEVVYESLQEYSCSSNVEVKKTWNFASIPWHVLQNCVLANSETKTYLTNTAGHSTLNE